MEWWKRQKKGVQQFTVIAISIMFEPNEYNNNEITGNKNVYLRKYTYSYGCTVREIRCIGYVIHCNRPVGSVPTYRISE